MQEGTKIEAGCVRIPRTANSWNYTFTFQNGTEYTDNYKVSIDFVADEGQKPEIGDYIVGGRLVKREGYQINQDHRMWGDKFTDTLEKDKLTNPRTWPGVR